MQKKKRQEKRLSNFAREIQLKKVSNFPIFHENVHWMHRIYNLWVQLYNVHNLEIESEFFPSWFSISIGYITTKNKNAKIWVKNDRNEVTLK